MRSGSNEQSAGPLQTGLASGPNLFPGSNAPFLLLLRRPLPGSWQIQQIHLYWDSWGHAGESDQKDSKHHPYNRLLLQPGLQRDPSLGHIPADHNRAEVGRKGPWPLFKIDGDYQRGVFRSLLFGHFLLSFQEEPEQLPAGLQAESDSLHDPYFIATVYPAPEQTKSDSWKQVSNRGLRRDPLQAEPLGLLLDHALLQSSNLFDRHQKRDAKPDPKEGRTADQNLQFDRIFRQYNNQPDILPGFRQKRTERNSVQIRPKLSNRELAEEHDADHPYSLPGADSSLNAHLQPIDQTAHPGDHQPAELEVPLLTVLGSASRPGLRPRLPLPQHRGGRGLLLLLSSAVQRSHPPSGLQSENAKGAEKATNLDHPQFGPSLPSVRLYAVYYLQRGSQYDRGDFQVEKWLNLRINFTDNFDRNSPLRPRCRTPWGSPRIRWGSAPWSRSASAGSPSQSWPFSGPRSAARRASLTARCRTPYDSRSASSHSHNLWVISIMTRETAPLNLAVFGFSPSAPWRWSGPASARWSSPTGSWRWLC